MTISKTCTKCNITFDVESEEELREHFYFKHTKSGDYLRNVCKVCEKQEHSEKYASGKYNYYSKERDKPASQHLKFGFL